MLLYPENWHYGYEQITADCQTNEEGQSVLLLCNADVDAMASARIVSYMLRSDGIHYQLLPCSNYAALDKHLRTVQLDSVRAIVLMNFGASRNLSKLFEEHEGLHENTKVYVLDCRRPVHLGNVYAGDNIVVFMDGTQDDAPLPSDGDNLSGNESSSDEEEESEESSNDDDDSSNDEDNDSGDESEEEAAFHDVVDATERKPSRERPNEQTAEYDGEDEDAEEGGAGDNDDDDDVADGNSAKRQRTGEPPVGSGNDENDEGATDVEQSDPESPDQKETALSPREMHRQRRERLRSYYNSGTFYGSPAAFIAYQLARQLRFGELGDLLWLACVGVTDAYLHSRVDLYGYTQMTIGLKESCFKLFPTDKYQNVINTVYAEDLMSASGGGDKTKITFSDNGRIVVEKDYRFFLLRHSSLFDSMVHSDHMSTKLQVWTKKGMHRLQELLAKMGYPLEECKQPFAFMRPSLKRRLHEKIMEQTEVRFFGIYYCCKEVLIWDTHSRHFFVRFRNTILEALSLQVFFE